MLGRIRDALIKRNQLNDNFRNQNGYSWDYVITFKIYDEIVVNALDHFMRLRDEMKKGKKDVKPVKQIRISIDNH